jgi:plasmid maintenance system antidote protein VapI
MAKKVGELNEGEIKKIRSESIGLVNDLDSIGKSINSSLQKVSELTGESVKAFKEGFSAANALGDAISKVDSQTLASKKQQVAFQDKVRKATEEATKLEAKATRLRQESVNFTKAQAKEAYRVARAYEDGAEKLREQATQAEKITDQFEKLNNQTKFFDGMADLTKDIPVISNVLKDFQKASDKAREAASEGGSAFKAGAKELANLGVKGLGALGIGFAVKGVNDLSERTTSLARNLNLSKQEARDLDQEFINLSFSLGKGSFTAKELEQYTVGFAQSMGAVGKLAPELTEEIALQQKFLGLSADESAKFAKFTLATGQDSKKLGNDIRGRVILSNALNKTAIDYKAITKDVANTSASIKISTAGTGKNLSQAAIEAKKLGLSLGQVDKIADSLLNFESSISAELEAELLTGQELNLENARRLALNNDLAGLSQELTKQNITQEKFGEMNRIQQEAIAKSLGMSREEMSEMLLEQKALSAFGASNAKDLDTAVKKEYEQVKLLEKQGKFAEAEVVRQKIINKLGSEEKITQLDNKSIAEMQALAAQKTVEAFNKLAPLLDVVNKVFGFINNHATAVAVTLGALAGLSIFRQFQGLLKVFKGLSGASKNIAKFLGIGAKSSEKVLTATMKTTGKTVSGAAAQSAVKAGTATASKTAAKVGAKTLGKSVLKKIPIIGALAGIGFGLSRLAEGDVLGAAGEVASGLAGTIPGVGTAASIGIDTALAARDIKKSSSIDSSETPMATGGIVTRPTRALIGEAGTEAVIPLDKFYAKLDELISVVKQGGDIYLDGTKMGTTMAVSTYKIQ